MKEIEKIDPALVKVFKVILIDQNKWTGTCEVNGIEYTGDFLYSEIYPVHGDKKTVNWFLFLERHFEHQLQEIVVSKTFNMPKALLLELQALTIKLVKAQNLN